MNAANGSVRLDRQRAGHPCRTRFQHDTPGSAGGDTDAVFAQSALGSGGCGALLDREGPIVDADHLKVEGIGWKDGKPSQEMCNGMTLVRKK